MPTTTPISSTDYNQFRDHVFCRARKTRNRLPLMLAANTMWRTREGAARCALGSSYPGNSIIHPHCFYIVFGVLFRGFVFMRDLRRVLVDLLVLGAKHISNPDFGDDCFMLDANRAGDTRPIYLTPYKTWGA